jgi:hypothetical protein
MNGTRHAAHRAHVPAAGLIQRYACVDFLCVPTTLMAAAAIAEALACCGLGLAAV